MNHNLGLSEKEQRRNREREIRELIRNKLTKSQTGDSGTDRGHEFPPSRPAPPHPGPGGESPRRAEPQKFKPRTSPVVLFEQFPDIIFSNFDAMFCTKLAEHSDLLLIANGQALHVLYQFVLVNLRQSRPPPSSPQLESGA